ncbi:c-type cytochrome domain-containing protein [Pleomorphovibrio marinus]|uniref:c-type cytochrome domain-containing protein n=1 Tax=Pleomorphovibrio marinus TaxID=2164132 RepID=UPI000E0A4F79|nr:c-type cytochrome domain-containing protein [Pleomorphovibrio marinus]
MLTEKLKAGLGQLLFATHMFVLVLVVAESRLVIPDWLHVFGRMHPLLLHFPIVVLLLAVLILAFPRIMKDPLDSYHYGSSLLLIGCLLAAFTVIAGLLLSHEEGYEREALQWHKWTGLLVFWISSILYAYLEKVNPSLQKAGMVVVALALLVSGHLGASITHGEDFLTAPLISQQEKLVSLEEAEVFDHVILPILEKKCISCHKASKQKGELRLDKPEFITTGGESGPALVPGDEEESLIFQRIHLPLEDEDHMPPKGKPQLSDEEKDLLSAWIRDGAVFDQKVLAFPDTTMTYQLAVQKFTSKPKSYDFPKADASTVENLNNFYRKVQALGMNSPAIAVSYFGRSAFDPSSLEDLKEIREQTVSLNLSNMPLKDEDLDKLSDFPNLERLYLNFTDISGEGLGHLRPLENLKLLSLSGNKIDDNGVENLQELKSLKQLFLWNSGLSNEQISTLQSALGDTYIETGYRDDGTVYQLNPPVIKFDKAFFQDQIEVRIEHAIQGTSLFYTLDGEEPDSSNYILYEGPLTIEENLTIKTRAFAEGWAGSETSTAEFIRSRIRPSSYTLNFPPADRHKGDGVNSLFDRKKAIPDVWNLNWLGFINHPLDVELSFEEPTDISSMSLSIWFNLGARFFPPQEVEIYLKDKDGDWQLAKTHKPNIPQKEEKALLKQLEIPFATEGVKEMRVVAKPLSSLPNWHGGAGGKAWLMVDELVMN